MQKRLNNNLLGCIRQVVSTLELRTEPDQELLRRFVSQRDEAAFTAIVRRHGPMVMRVAVRTLQNEHDAEDVFQATFLVLNQKSHSLRRQGSLGSWLYGIAYRIALKAKATAGGRRNREQRVTPTPVAGPLAQVTVQEAQTILDEELHRLPEQLREPVVLCCLEGLARDEAAQRIGCPASVLKSRLERGRERLRLRLIARGLTLPCGLGAFVLLECAAGAALPPALIASTTKAAIIVAAGKAVSTVATAKVAALTQGVLKTMFLTKLKTAVVVALLVSFVSSAGILFYHPLASYGRVQDPQVSRLVAQAGARPGAPLKSPMWRERAALSGHTDQVNTVAISRDGKLLASGGQDKDVILWDRATEKVKKTLRGHKHPISCVAFSPDGTIVASGSFGFDEGEQRVGEIKLWDVTSGKERAAFKLGEAGGQVWSISFSSDGKLLAASGDLGLMAAPNDNDQTFGVVTVWDVATGKEKATFKEDPLKIGDTISPLPLFSVAFSTDGKLMAMCANNKVKLLDPLTQKVVLSLEEREDKDSTPIDVGSIVPMFTGVAFSPDGKTIATVHSKAGVQLWDAESGKVRTTLPKREGKGWYFGNSLAFSADGKTLITVRNLNQTKEGFYVSSGEVSVWDTSTGKERRHLPAETWLTSVAMSRDGKMLAVGSRGNVKRKANKDPSPKESEPVGDKKGTVRIWELQD